MIRLLCCIGSLQGGGAERQLVQLLRRLDRTRFEPWLYLVNRAGPLLAEVPPDVRVIAFSDRSSAPRWNWPGLGFRRRVADLTEVLREQRIDCVYDRTYHMTLLTAPACARAGVPRVSTVVSEPKSDFDHQERRFRTLKWWLLGRAYRTADRVVAVSEGVRQGLLESHHLAPEQVVTIYNPLDTERIERLAREPLPEWWNVADRHIVAVGRLQPEKDPATLVEAFRLLLQDPQFDDVRLHLLGEGGLRGDLESRIRAAGLTKHVFLPGFAANPYPCIAAADLLGLSSRHEGLPGAILEALALQTPVVSTDCRSGPSELLAEGAFGTLVPVGRPDRLAEGLAAVLHDPAGARRRAAAGREHLHRLCGTEATLGRLEDLLDEVVRNRRLES